MDNEKKPNSLDSTAIADAATRGSFYGLVVNNKQEPLSNIEVSIKSFKVAEKTDNAAQRLLKLFSKKKSGQKDDLILIERKTNPVGMFFTGQFLPKGVYEINCTDPGDKYIFTTRVVELKSQTNEALIIAGKEKTEKEAEKKDVEKKPEEAHKNQKDNEDENKEKLQSEKKEPEVKNENSENNIHYETAEPKNNQESRYTSAEERLAGMRAEAAAEHSRALNQKDTSIHLPDGQTVHEYPTSQYSPVARSFPGRQMSQGGPGQTAPTTEQQNRQAGKSQNPRNRGIPGIGNKTFNNVKNIMSGNFISIPGVSNLQQIRWFVNPYFIILATTIIIYIIFFSGLLDGSPFNISGGGGDQTPSQTTTNPQKNPIKGGICPGTTENHDPATCKYLSPAIDIYSTDISQEAVDKYIEKYSPVFVNAGLGDKAEFARRTNYIISSAKRTGLNPAIFLGYWKSESLFGTVGTRELGCAANSFEEEVDCATGLTSGGARATTCAKSRDANSPECIELKGIRSGTPGKNDFAYPISYPVSTFDDYAEAYGTFSDDPDGRKGNCTHSYNLLVEVAKELGACSAKPAVTTNPGNIPNPPSDIKQGIFENFAITMNGFDEDHLKWAWDELWEASSTNFTELVRGITIEASSGGSAQLGCAGAAVAVKLGQYTPESFFKFILTHELGHVIQSCQPRAKSHFTEAQNAYDTEGGISYYGNNASSCNGTVNVNENYADIVAYYLHSQAGLASGPISCGGPQNPPNPFFSGTTQFPLSFSVGEQVLKSEQIQ